MVEKRRNTLFRQRQIVAAAAELIIRHGSEHLTIKSLARRTKLSEAAIYRHFRSKKDIYHFLLEHIGMTLLTDLRRCDSRHATGQQDIDSLIDMHISEIVKSRGVEFQVIAEIISMGNAALNQETLGIISSYISGLEKIFGKQIKSKYYKNEAEAECLALAFFTLLQGLVNLWSLSGYAFDLKRRFYQVWTVHLKASEVYETLAQGRDLKYNQNNGIGG